MDTPSVFVESPILTGRVIAELYQNKDNILAELGGKISVTAELAKKFGIVDPISKITPPSIRSIKFLLPSIVLGKMNIKDKETKEKIEKILISLSPDILIPMKLMEGGTPNQ